jgi:hypothetical protein
VEIFAGFEKDFGNEPEHPESDQSFGLIPELNQSIVLLGTDKDFLRRSYREEKVGIFLGALSQESNAGLLVGSEEEGGEVIVFVGGPLDKIKDIFIRADEILPFFCCVYFNSLRRSSFRGG